MSRSRRPGKSYQLQHKRLWIHQKQLQQQRRSPRLFKEAVVQGLDEHQENGRDGSHRPSLWCSCLGCED